MTKTTPFDPADYLTSDEMIAEFLTSSLESEDSPTIRAALKAVARARGGVQALAQQTGVGAGLLDETLNDDGALDFVSVLKVMHALGVRMSVSMVA